MLSLVTVGVPETSLEAAAKKTPPKAVAPAARKAVASSRPKASAPRKTSAKASASTSSRPTPSSGTIRMTRTQRLAIARAAQTRREIEDTITPRYKVDASGDLVPDLRAAAAVIYDPETREILWEEHSQDTRAIASITKVMTALVFLDSNSDPSEAVTVERSDVYRASTTHLRARDVVTKDDLLHLLLIASDNAAARVLARTSPWGADGFIGQMNKKAEDLGLTSTHYVEPSGLSSSNVSSALDLARLITLASADDRIGSIMRTPEYTAHAKSRNITFRSTNHLLKTGEVDVRAGKTGFISAAGYCLATLLRLPQSGQEVAVVVLGARSNAGRFMEVKNLFNWMSAKAPAILATQALPALTQQQQQQQQ